MAGSGAGSHQGSHDDRPALRPVGWRPFHTTLSPEEARTGVQPPPITAAAPVALRARVRAAVERAWADAVASRSPADDRGRSAARRRSRSSARRTPAFGDFATNLAMKLARPAPPVAPRDRRGARRCRCVATAGAGLIAAARGGATRVRQPARARAPRTKRLLDGILAAPATGAGSRRSTRGGVNVEFVSANPTGPLTVGNARGAFVGDLLCRVLEAGGQTRHPRVLLQRLRAPRSTTWAHRWSRCGAAQPRPRGRLQGRLRRRPRAGACRRMSGRRPTADGDRRRGRRRPLGLEAGAGHDRGAASSGWASTSTSGRPRARLHEEGWVARAVERLRAAGHVYEQDGALWFRSTAFGDDKDRVIYRSRRPARRTSRPTSAT